MAQPSYRSLECGTANLATGWAAQYDGPDGTVGLRKGQLYFCCPAAVSQARLDRVSAAYYQSPSYDVLPSLRSALWSFLTDGEGATEIAALVVLGVEVWAIATSEMQVLQVRENGMLDLLRMAEAWSPDAPDPGASPPPALLAGAQTRLSLSDTVVALPRQVVADRGASRTGHLVRRAADAQTAASRLARGHHGAPILTFHTRGFTPSAEIGPVESLTPSHPTRAQLVPRRGRSPIGVAALIALVAFAAVYYVKRPTFGRDELERLGAFLLTPAVTSSPLAGAGIGEDRTATIILTEPRPTTPVPPTPITPTARPRPTLRPSPSPTLAVVVDGLRLVSPGKDETYHQRELVLRWAWSGQLADDQYFDVRLSPLGAAPKSIAWTKEREYTERIPGSGWHTWTVLLVQGRDGHIENELARAEAVNFRWSPPGESEPLAKPTDTPPPSTPVPPTRVNPTPGPTRGTPAATRSAS